MALVQWNTFPPYGKSNLKPGIAGHYHHHDPDHIRDDRIICCIDGCQHWMNRRRKGRTTDFCPDHHISLSPDTYVHRKATQNLFVLPEIFLQIRKTENRLTNENSEDALSWNVFVGFYALRALDQIFFALTGVQPKSEPQLYLWGNCIQWDKCFRWPDLEKIQNHLEPGKRIKTEPDIMLRVPRQALVLIEAKFRSPNSRYDKKASRCGRVANYFKNYVPRADCVDPFNREWIYSAPSDQVLEQLCRNSMFAHHLAEPGEQVFLVNLVSSEFELQVEEQFKLHLTEGQITFRRFTWEQLAMLPVLRTPPGEPLKSYFDEKTYSLRPAFPSFTRSE